MIFSIENYEPYTGEYYLGEGVYIDLTEDEIDEMLNQEIGEEVTMEKEPRKKNKFRHPRKRPYRDARKRFVDGQKIRHMCGNSVWIGVYNSDKNSIICNGFEYIGGSPLNKFAVMHYKKARPDRTSNVNAWTDCECEEHGVWVSTDRLIE